MSELREPHICSDDECIYLGKPSANSCRCHLTAAENEIASLRERVAEMQYEAGMYHSLYEVAQQQLASARKAAIEECAKHFEERKYGADRYLFPDEIASELRGIAHTDELRGEK